ncbi:hypothetical protein CPB84DRAFT_1775662 [Gymnopilus junonius]|uniref:USP domain-containing protein n=1 Tax=Gymnopilus junonius TaxID=109634 RepID=A0A9P5NQ42_GYMJU|nr:hypothetical protein CPB84DRAFT_1775662 [Gymnopilus junonius]
MQLTTEQEQLERDNGEFLATITNVHSDIAIKALRKHNGDMEKAADALLDGYRGEDWETKHRTTPEPTHSDGLTTSTSSANAALPSASVIDLTNDDDDMTRAIQMSMETSSQTQTQPHFGPTDRAPHPEWQMVRSNAPVQPIAIDEDHNLNEAIQASLQDFKEDVEEASPFKQTIRDGGRPIALRTDTRALAYATLVIQALYFIPQVRATVSTLRLPGIDPDTPLDHPDHAMWTLIELFTNMDLAQLAAIVDNELLTSLDILPFDGRHTLGEASAIVVKTVGTLIEQHMQAQAGPDEEPELLFSFTHGHIQLVNDLSQKISRSPEDGVVVNVDFGHGSLHNDLISCISDHLNQYTTKGSMHDVILKPSDLITFNLKRHPAPSGTSSASPDPFVYPKAFFLDRFLFDNLALTNSKRKKEREMLEEIKQLNAYKETLTRSEGRDALQDLKATIYYYEEVADPSDDPVRERALKAVADHLRDIVTMIEGKVEDIDHQLEKLQADVALVYDCPELQIFQYDLRAVLVHTGLPGRKQMYSYVQDTEGAWWKTVDQEVTEAPEETVLTDPSGLHLGAGPYMLFYSRHLTDEQLHEPLVWPSIFSNAVEENNKKFLEMMHPELEIFSATRETTELPPVTRELPVPHERRGTVSRQSSMAAMDVDDPSSMAMSQ